MSFTGNIVRELSALQIKKTCCRKSAVFGLAFGASCADGETLVSNFCDSTAAKLFCELLLRTFHVKSEMLEGVRAGRRIYTVKYECNAIYDFLLRMENNEAETLSELVGFRCDGCRSSFLRGVFIAMGSVSDPQKTYHLEISLPSERRADLVASLMSSLMGRVGRIKRGQRYSVYYKNNGAILDFLYFIGCAKAGEYMTNRFIEKDIRNNENRATNCVARNIEMSVKAARKQIEAIELLSLSGRLEVLPEELRYTAKLRLENPTVSLSELAELHVPVLSKSGLNRRLARLIEESEK